MALTLAFFMTPEDELAFLRALEPLKLDVYPEFVAMDYRPFRASAQNAAKLADEAYYLSISELGEPVGRTVRRGPNAGMQEIDEVRSAVMHWERSVEVEGELRSGRVWAEIEVLGDRQHRMTKPDLMRTSFEEIREFFKKRFHRSSPTGFFVGPRAARRFHEGLVLREAGRKGGLVQPYK